MSEKKKQILTIAEKLFYENGFHHVGLKRIVSDSGVALMTLYNHFSSKEELIQEVLSIREERYLSLLSNCGQGSTHQKAKSIAKIHAEWLSSQRNGCMLLRAKEEYANVNQAIVDQVVEHKKNLIELFVTLGFNQRQSNQLTLVLEGSTSLAEVLDPKDVTSELTHLIDQVIVK